MYVVVVNSVVAAVADICVCLRLLVLLASGVQLLLAMICNLCVNVFGVSYVMSIVGIMVGFDVVDVATGVVLVVVDVCLDVVV